MDCPSCHSENVAEAVDCSTCGRSLRSDEAGATPSGQPSPRGGSRRRRNTNADNDDAANDNDNPAARRAYVVTLWALLPGLGLLLGPAAVFLGWRAVRGSSGASSRNQAKVAVLFGVLIALTQWLGVALMIYGWSQK
jgi:hypothetical protein